MKIKIKLCSIALTSTILVLFLIFISSTVSAASTISFNPQTTQMGIGSSQNVQIMMDKVPDGLSGFYITVWVSDPEIAKIAEASSPSWNMITKNSTSSVPSSSVWIRAIDIGRKVEPGAINVSLGNITLNGTKIGTTNLSIQPHEVDNDNGNAINLAIVQGQINVLDDNKAPVTNSVSLNNNTPNTSGSILETIMKALQHLQI